MAALGYLMDSLFSEALVIMVMQSAVGPVPRELIYGPFIPCSQGPTLSVNLLGKHFRSSLLRVTMAGPQPSTRGLSRLAVPISESMLALLFTVQTTQLCLLSLGSSSWPPARDQAHLLGCMVSPPLRMLSPPQLFVS